MKFFQYLLLVVLFVGLSVVADGAVGERAPGVPGRLPGASRFGNRVKPSINFKDWKAKFGHQSNLFKKFNTTKILQNEALQRAGKAAKAQVSSQIVDSADPVALMSGTGDVSTTGACKKDFEKYCATVTPGEGRVSKCLTDIKRSKLPSEKLTIGCKLDLRNFRIVRAQNINSDIPLAMACRKDAKKYCNTTNLYAEPGAVITCLREVEEKLSSSCEKQIHRTKAQASDDYELDAMLYELCEEDAKALCDGIKPEGGAVQTCLRSKRASLTWDCQEELFRKEVEDADDYRLNPTLLRLCSADKKKFCSDVQPGMGRAIECLEESRKKPGFSSECKSKFEEMMARRSADFRLDAKLREECREDIEEVCGYEKDSLDSVAGYDGRVIECLQDYKDELAVPSCKNAVHKLTERAAEDIRMDRPLADSCFEDRKKLCAGIEPGNARVLRCLQEQRSNLTYECRATLFDQEVRFAEDIDFQYPLKTACSSEIGLFCKGIPHGHARIIQCLMDHDGSKEMSPECHAEVKRSELRDAEDYRLNYRVNKACDMEIDNICPDVCSPFQGQACKGKVLSCLMENIGKISSKECVAELTPTVKREVKDVKVSPILRSACAADMKTHCRNNAPVPAMDAFGTVGMHCLQEALEDLAPKCRAEVEKLTKIEMSNIHLSEADEPCAEEMKVYCKGVEAGKNRMFRCLKKNRDQPDFGQACKSKIAERSGILNKGWNLDQVIYQACGEAVEELCPTELAMKEAGQTHDALVLSCLVQKFKSITNRKCAKRVGVKFFDSMKADMWHKGSPISRVCDTDVDRYCKTLEHPITCLGKLNETDPIEPDCATMLNEVKTSKASIEVFNTMLKNSESIASTFAALGKSSLERGVGKPKMDMSYFEKTGKIRRIGDKRTSEEIARDMVMSQRQKSENMAELQKSMSSHSQTGVTVTGWVAVAGIGALIVVVAAASWFAYRKATGYDKVGQHTMVVKGGDI